MPNCSFWIWSHTCWVSSVDDSDYRNKWGCNVVVLKWWIEVDFSILQLLCKRLDSYDTFNFNASCHISIKVLENIKTPMANNLFYPYNFIIKFIIKNKARYNFLYMNNCEKSIYKFVSWFKKKFGFWRFIISGLILTTVPSSVSLIYCSANCNSDGVLKV